MERHIPRREIQAAASPALVFDRAATLELFIPIILLIWITTDCFKKLTRAFKAWTSTPSQACL